ncbi:54S ribosomal protein L9, mitochondrial [Coccidioides posadasii str. Silveira]|uniref:Large ribosomal subunit protein uL3m n=3 Tax=Coccidioides posadasii TaxID=199306 RepID=E9D0K3_COCPS|nr:mitochondrial 54S ribosomal protein YmL9 [Coccidioides posadasii C735 delta SOWgp]EER26039.1 54S ribosomal protein L9, mitochondrial precursor, putative [Coccidioides posadasii C735 delta SOWgp]EFW19857.1 50S ribosomal protein L3 [Coccidioides posadasii str. Silveira]KMM73574.1 50S ribosomal protein L3 [Coccidioides posadasii RMSCC 3488]QVM08969.1 54S ribosomal protein L9, mitochondrial [Coccidioides posadasii str. Silveira]|eukprot:XP_003068184.1 mitochondrial 54S ribosomal protein YmL9 [Coccidioides posadasii C735 delta SOWgp]
MPPRLKSKSFQQLLAPVIIPQPAVTYYVPQRSFGIKALYPPKTHRFNVGPDMPVLTSSPSSAYERKMNTLPLRTGALAIKKGMSAVIDPETGKRTVCTILQLDRVEVISHKTRQKHGYFAVQVGAGWKHESNVTKPMLGHFAANGVSPKRYVEEFRVRDEAGLLPIGQMINADWFQEGQFVDVRSKSRGMGFTGVMKRWGFHGQDRSHGVSLTHRSLGTTGPSQGGGSRVYPGKKMAGNMGNTPVTIQNLRVLQVDPEKGLVVVKGSVGGPKGRCVKIHDAIKKPWPETPS